MFNILMGGLSVIVGSQMIQIGVTNVTDSMTADDRIPEDKEKKLSGQGYVRNLVCAGVGGSLLVYGVRAILDAK